MFRRAVSRWPLALVLTLVLGSTAGLPAQDSSRVLKFTRLSVKDPGINNIEAISFLIPSGWKAEGGVQWFPDYSILANLLMRISDPQSGAAIEFLPLQNFTWLTQMVVPMQPGTNYLGNILWQPVADVSQFIQLFYLPQTLRHLQGARVVARDDLPKLANEVARSFGGQSTVKSARIRYEYQLAGRGRNASTARWSTRTGRWGRSGRCTRPTPSVHPWGNWIA